MRWWRALMIPSTAAYGGARGRQPAAFQDRPAFYRAAFAYNMEYDLSRISAQRLFWSGDSKGGSRSRPTGTALLKIIKDAKLATLGKPDVFAVTLEDRAPEIADILREFFSFGTASRSDRLSLTAARRSSRRRPTEPNSMEKSASTTTKVPASRARIVRGAKGRTLRHRYEDLAQCTTTDDFADSCTRLGEWIAGPDVRLEPPSFTTRKARQDCVDANPALSV